MIDIVKPLQALLNFNKVWIDNSIFRLHYRFTVLVLVVMSVLVTSRQYFGDPIDCTSSDKFENEKFVDTYCWIHSTFIYTEKIKEKEYENCKYTPPDGKPVPTKPYEEISSDEPKRFNRYYQWVWIVLFLQAVCFIVPHWLWKTWEGDRMKGLTEKIRGFSYDISDNEDDRAKGMKLILDYFAQNKGHHQMYLAQFALCETLNFVNVIVQFAFIDKFLEYPFGYLGLDLFTGKPCDRVDPLKYIFPTVTSCVVNAVGVEGTKYAKPHMCVLPINILNEKIYCFLWFWFVILATLSAIALLYRLVFVFIPLTRRILVRRNCRGIDDTTMNTLLRDFDHGDWFFLSQIGRNVGPIAFTDIVRGLGDRVLMNQFKA